MRSSPLFCLLAAALAVPSAGLAVDARIVSHRDVATPIEVKDLETAADGSLSGTLHNVSSTVVKDIKLLVKHTWSWNDERHPGGDSPGRSAYVAVPGEIAPAASAPFSYTPNPPLPKRADGTFETTAGVQEFTQVGE